MLRRETALDRPIDVAHRLRAAGLTLGSAHAVVNSLADRGDAACRIARDAGIDGLARDLRALGISVHRRAGPDPAIPALIRRYRRPAEPANDAAGELVGR